MLTPLQHVDFYERGVYSDISKKREMSIRLDTALALDRETDRQTDNKQYRDLHTLHADAR